MPSNRRSNAAQKRGRGAKAQTPHTPLLSGAANDICAVLLIVVAIAMIVALVSNSSAPVTAATGDFLRLCFGVGALLIPISIILFAATMFTDEEESFGGRVALGLFLIVLALLGIISINIAGADLQPDTVLAPAFARVRGGLVGGAVAWSLIKTVGVAVGNVALVGIILSGIIVCGFSLSDMVSRLRGRASTVKDKLQSHLAETRAEREANRQARQAERDVEPVYSDTPEAPKTSYIGARKTSVLSRANNKLKPIDEIIPEEDVQDEPMAAPTKLLRKNKKKQDEVQNESLDLEFPEDSIPLDEEAPKTQVVKREAKGDRTQVKASEVAPEATVDTTETEEPAIPDFLKQTSAKPKRKARAVEDVAGPATAVASRATQATAPKPKKKSASSTTTKRPGDGLEGYELPPMDMLSQNPLSAATASSKEELDETKARLQACLQEFGLSSKVVDYVSGPIVTTFRIEMGDGERVNKIKNLEEDIALTLAAEKVRIFAPIKGTSYVGIEIPNKKRTSVHLGDVLGDAGKGVLEVAIGRDSSGNPVLADIAKMPHLLVAGTTGSGKSVMINSMIMSILMRATPKQVRMIMIDPKRVEFSGYNGLPHLYVPVVTEPRQAASALQWAVSEMERRLKVFERATARNIVVYNDMCVNGKLAELDNPPEPMPYIMVVIDELSDLMMVAGKDVEASIVRIAQLARAAGIHLVIATQRPSANVVTGLIKSNIDSRIALKVSSGIDSRVILDETGAERLLGNGDMLFKNKGLAPQRVLGCYTSDEEIESVVSFIRDQAEPDYHEEILSQVVPGMPSGSTSIGDISDDDDPLVWEAAQIVVDSQLGSTSGLQRRLKVGYARAGRIMDMLQAKGVVGPPDGSKPREVLLDSDGLEELRQAEALYREV